MKNIEKVLEIRIAILRDKCREQSDTFDRMNNKMFALVGVLLTLGGLLTYDVFKINFPSTILEYILLTSALILLGASASLIGYDYRAKRTWSVPIGPVEEEKLNNINTYAGALSIIHEDYHEVYSRRDRSLSRKAKLLNASLHTLVAGIILLIVLKIGG